MVRHQEITHKNICAPGTLAYRSSLAQGDNSRNESMLVIAGIHATVLWRRRCSVSLEVRPGQISNLRVETEMNWDRIEDKWTRIKGSAIEQWDDLTEDRLASRIQETYGNSDDEAE